MKYPYYLFKCCRYVFSILGFLAIQAGTGALFAQGGVEYGNEQVQKSFAKAVKTYDNYIGKNAFVYSGRAYFSSHEGIKGTQFFIDDYWVLGNVVYDNNAYDSIDLKYDIYSDQLIVENFGLSGYPAPILLYSPKVRSFQLHGYDFVRIDSDSLSKIKSGYYNLMYDGVEAKLLIKRRKEIVKINEINTIREVYLESDKYFIKKDGTYYPVKKKNSVLKVLGDKNKELKSYMRSNAINFKNNTDNQLAEVLKYYDSLF